MAKQCKRPFAGSTSSLTGLLSHCYFLISGDKEVDTSSLSRAFHHQVSVIATKSLHGGLDIDDLLSANKFYPGTTHAYIRGAQLQGRSLVNRL